MNRRAFISGITVGLLGAPLAAEAQGGYKPEFKLSVVVNEDTAWGRAAIRFADAVRSRIAGRIQVKPYFSGRAIAPEPVAFIITTEHVIVD
jgi:TRAP-type C4-dicarboxylate transport system substrate-binding protein